MFVLARTFAKDESGTALEYSLAVAGIFFGLIVAMDALDSGIEDHIGQGDLATRHPRRRLRLTGSCRTSEAGLTVPTQSGKRAFKKPVAGFKFRVLPRFATAILTKLSSF
jgi:Flp pilus assembly pilin Flp